MLVLAVIIFVGYYLVPVSKAQNVYLGAIGAVEILFWLFTAVMMGVKKILGTQEILFIVMECVLIVACCAGLCILSPKKEKGNWTSVRIVESVCAVALFGSATYVAVQYHNELISAGINIVMFGLCALCVLLYWWFADSVNHFASVIVVIGQAITFLYCFSSLCRKKESVELFSGAYKSLRALLAKLYVSAGKIRVAAVFRLCRLECIDDGVLHVPLGLFLGIVRICEFDRDRISRLDQCIDLVCYGCRTGRDYVLAVEFV